MKLLVLASYYPNDGHPFSGPFTERNAITLKNLCDSVEVLAPRPFVPPLLSSLKPRWQAYTKIPQQEIRNGLSVYRPAYLELPRFGTAFWRDRGVFFASRETARAMHKRVGFNAIVSFDLFGAGGLAWRLGHDLGIPASGWAYGSDLAQQPGTPRERVVIRALQRLDLVFYQSFELLDTAAGLLGLSPDQMQQDKHMVLAHGIPEPPVLPKEQTRKQIRSTLGITNEQIVVMNFGRVVREKGIFELLEAMALANQKDPRIACVIIGSNPSFDETPAVQKTLNANPYLCERVKFLPACRPDQTWEYLCAADIFVFPSHQRFEGMPNSLQEAMVMGVPAVAFASRPVLELAGGTGVLLHVPPFDTTRLADAILQLAASPRERSRLGDLGKARVLEHFMVKKNIALAYQRLSQMVEQHTTQQNRSRPLESHHDRASLTPVRSQV
jgi:teichuronic acid biosynthesis glycosyltransferase TuaC